MFGFQFKRAAAALALGLMVAGSTFAQSATTLSKPTLTMTKVITSTGSEYCKATVKGNLTLSTNDQAILNSNASIAYKLRVTVEAVDGAFAGGFEGVATNIPDQLIKGPVGSQLSYSRPDDSISMYKCNEDPNNWDEFVARVKLLDADGRVITSALSDQLQQQFE